MVNIYVELKTLVLKMKKILMLAVMLISTMSAFSQIFRESVYLKNGSVIKGNIVEFQPNKLIKLETSDGSLFVFEFKDIEKITRERVSSDSRYTRKNSVAVNNQENVFCLNPGSYRGFVSLEAVLGDFIGMRLSTTHGKQLNKKIFLGGGVGMLFAEDWAEDHFSIPVFADFRVDFVDKKISPYMELRTGVDFALYGETGFYGNFSLGCRFKRSSISFGVETLRGNYYDDDDYDWVYEDDVDGGYYYRDDWDSSYNAFNFVTRFSFEF